MKRIAIGATVALCVLPAGVFAASGEALAPWFERVPVPPKPGSAEAQARVAFQDGRAVLRLPAFDALQQQLDARNEALQRQQQANQAQGEVAAEGMHQDLNAAAGEDVSSPEFQAKLEKMSDAERMAFAMKMNTQMQKSMGASYAHGASMAGPETAAVQAAQHAYASYQQQLGMQMAQQPQGATQLIPQFEQAHIELDRRLARDAASCVAGGGGPAAKTCLQGKSAACWDQHIALAAQQSGKLQPAFQQQLAQGRKAAAEADRVLAPTQYGAAAHSFLARQQLVAYQSQMLGDVGALMSLSKAATLSAGAWTAGKAGSAGAPLYVGSGSEASCGYESRFGRDGSSGGRSGSSRRVPAPAAAAAKTVQDGAKKVLNWIGH